MSYYCSNFKHMSDQDKFVKIMTPEPRYLHIYTVEAWNMSKTNVCIIVIMRKTNVCIILIV